MYRMDPSSGSWAQVQLVGDLANPSFLTLDHQLTPTGQVVKTPSPSSIVFA